MLRGDDFEKQGWDLPINGGRKFTRVKILLKLNARICDWGIWEKEKWMISERVKNSWERNEVGDRGEERREEANVWAEK